MAEKYRCAEVILYPCNMVVGWKSKIEELIQYPFVACLHDRDNCEPHIHLILCRGNGPATLKWFINWCNRTLSNPDKTYIDYDSDGNKVVKPCCCCSTASPIVSNFQRAYDYLYHGGLVADKCCKEGKFAYSQTDLFFGNNFDIHHYIQVDTYDKMIIAQKICEHIKLYNLMDDIAVYDFCVSQGDDYFAVYCSKSAMFSRLCGGNWKKWERSRKDK